MTTKHKKQRAGSGQAWKKEHTSEAPRKLVIRDRGPSFRLGSVSQLQAACWKLRNDLPLAHPVLPPQQFLLIALASLLLNASSWLPSASLKDHWSHFLWPPNLLVSIRKREIVTEKPVFEVTSFCICLTNTETAFQWYLYVFILMLINVLKYFICRDGWWFTTDCNEKEKKYQGNL